MTIAGGDQTIVPAIVTAAEAVNTGHNERRNALFPDPHTSLDRFFLCFDENFVSGTTHAEDVCKSFGDESFRESVTIDQ
jgi:hypothetical protein